MTRIPETSPRPAAPRLKGQEAPWVGPLKPGLRRPRRAATAWALSDSRCRIRVRLDPGATWLLGAPQCRASWSSGPRCGPLVSLRVVSGSGMAAGQGSPTQRHRVLPELLHPAAGPQKPVSQLQKPGCGDSACTGIHGAGGEPPGECPAAGPRTTVHSAHVHQSLWAGAWLQRSRRSPRSRRGARPRPPRGHPRRPSWRSTRAGDRVLALAVQ